MIGLGFYTRGKNVELVIRAIGCTVPPRPELVWVGNVADAGLLERSTALAQGVAFRPLTRIGDDELVGLLNHAAAMVYAPRLEPFGLAPIEAAACGLPLVAVAEGDVRETVIDGVTSLLVGSDPAAIAAWPASCLTRRSRDSWVRTGYTSPRLTRLGEASPTRRISDSMAQPRGGPPCRSR